MPLHKVVGSTTTYSTGSGKGINLDRPWQQDTTDLIDQEKCPFCTKEQNDHVSPHSDWRVIVNPQVSMATHFLIIPSQCPDANFLTTLGGAPGLRSVFLVVDTLMREENLFGERMLVVHVGRLAGQTQGHLHWHMMQAKGENPLIVRAEDYPPGRHIFDVAGISANADGVRAGQVMLVPRGTVFPSFREVRENLATALSRLVTLGNERFSSSQGHTPNFTVVVRFRHGNFLYATYVPILHQLGGYDMVAALERGPFSLPWTHEETAKHLD